MTEWRARGGDRVSQWRSVCYGQAAEGVIELPEEEHSRWGGLRNDRMRRLFWSLSGRRPLDVS